MYLKRVKSSLSCQKIEGEGISAHILTNVHRHLDYLKKIDNARENCIVPALLADGHSSRFDMGFLTLIFDENHKWTVVFVASYGT